MSVTCGIPQNPSNTEGGILLEVPLIWEECNWSGVICVSQSMPPFLLKQLGRPETIISETKSPKGFPN